MENQHHQNHEHETENKLQEVQAPAPAQANNLSIPIAIVIAGALIAGAVYFGTSKSANNDAVNSQGQQAQVQQPVGQAAGQVKAVDPATDHIRGDRNAKVFVIEYSDFECPFCKRFHPTMQQIVSDYQGKVAWVYRHFPLSFHQNAQKEAEASECANELGGNDAFWKYADKIFERTTSNGTGFALSELVPLAKEIGLNETGFKSCLDSGKYAQHVQQDESEGAAAGVTGTPGNIVWSKNGKSQLVEGAVPLASIKTVVDQLLK